MSITKESPLVHLGLGVRIERAMMREGVLTVGQLLDLTPHKLQVMRGFGEHNVFVVIKEVGSLSLAEVDPAKIIRERPNTKLTDIFPSIS